MCCTPSANDSIPVTKLLSSEARNETAQDISSRLPILPNRIVLAMYFLTSSDSSSFWAAFLNVGVFIGPELYVCVNIAMIKTCSPGSCVGSNSNHDSTVV
jgi:hypothetical protein